MKRRPQRLGCSSWRLSRRAIVSSAFLLAVFAPAGAASAAPREWSALATQMAQPWSALQNADGTFRDYVYGGNVSFCLQRSCAPGFGNARYGESVLGFALLQRGIDTRDGHLIDTGLKALNFVADHPELQRTLPTVFEGLAMSSAYNLARARIAKRPLFAQHRTRWIQWLRRVEPAVLGGPVRYYNHTLVEAVEVLELLRTGLRSRVRGAILSRRGRVRMRRLAVDLINRRIPRLTEKTGRVSRGERGMILSDARDYPLAYHGFSLGFYARALQLLGKRASKEARQLLRRLAHGSWLLTGPDGDLGYVGRSAEDSWSLSATAFGARLAARLRGTNAAHRARDNALADRAIERMRTAYGVGPGGPWIVPALAKDAKLGLLGIDAYSGAAAFGGLALIQLNWAIEVSGTRLRPGKLAADYQGTSQVLRRGSTLTLVRSAGRWFALRQAPSTRYVSDLRYDFGLVALKQGSGGQWRDVLPLRPISSGPPSSAGPLLLLPNNGIAVPYGTDTKVGRGGVVTVTGGFRLPAGAYIRRGVNFRFEPTPCGVRMTFPVAAGDVVEYSAFMRGTIADVHATDTTVADGSQVVTFSQQAQFSFEEGYVSAVDPRLVRARAVLRPGIAGLATVTICGR
jgi:hypothetical protein